MSYETGEITIDLTPAEASQMRLHFWTTLQQLEEERVQHGMGFQPFIDRTTERVKEDLGKLERLYFSNEDPTYP